MKKVCFMFFMVFAMVSTAISCMADQGTVDARMDDKDYHLVFESIDVKNGKVNIVISGYDSALRMAENGWGFPAIPVAHYGDEELPYSLCTIGNNGSYGFSFDRSDVPDSVWMDTGEEQVLIWEAGTENDAVENNSTDDKDETEDEAADGALDETEDVLFDETETEEIKELTAEDILTALGEPVYEQTYAALLSGERIQNGTKGETARGLQQTLIAFGREIAADGSTGPKTLEALNAVQNAFGLDETQEVDAEIYAKLLPGLLITVKPRKAKKLLASRMENDEYLYMCACAEAAAGNYYSAKLGFEDSQWNDWEDRAKGCVQEWPGTGQLYSNPEVGGNSAELAVQYNTERDAAMFIKVYTPDDVLARTMFIAGSGEAVVSLPGGNYRIKTGVGKNWYGEKESFGKAEGLYDILTFENGEELTEIPGNYRVTISINVQNADVSADNVGSDYERWEDF